MWKQRHDIDSRIAEVPTHVAAASAEDTGGAPQC